MYSHDDYHRTQLTFYYIDGHTETFTVYQPMGEDATGQQLQINMRHLLDSPWWILNLPEQTVFINLANVLKVEASPALPELQGRDVFSFAERVTALNRAARQ